MINKLKEVYTVCFNDKPQYIDYVFKYKYDTENAVYNEVNGEIVSELFIVLKKLYIRGNVISCPYICGVCTLPQHRKKGYAEIIMNRSFDKLFLEGFSICALHPFNHDFYRKFGFTTYTKVKKYTAKYCGYEYKNLEVKNACLSDIPLMVKLYNNFMKNFNGYVYRGDAEMISRYNEMKSGGQCKIICYDKIPAGYFFYDNYEVEEYCADTKYLSHIKEIDGKTVYLPNRENLGNENDFTMIKLLNREKYLNELNLDLKIFQKYDNNTVLHTTLGSYADFNINIAQELKQYFSNMQNFVFDKY